MACSGDGNDDLLIPENVIFHILLLLPVVSLLRFKTVCKTWCSIIETPDFIAQHLRRRPRPTVFKEWNTNLIQLYSADKLEFHNIPRIADPFQFHPVKMVASCNGIVCLRQNRTLCLWNPAKRQAVSLPPIPLVPIASRFFIGFGYDVKTDDYKVVCLSLNLARPDFVDSIHVYSLRSDSWRIMDNVVFPVVWVSTQLKTPYSDGIYCWLGMRNVLEDTETIIIIYFDFSDEVFGDIQLPDSITRPFSMTLAILRDKIACVYSPSVHLEGTKQRHVEIWMLNDYRVKESWTKLYTVGYFSVDWYCLTGFSVNTDFLALLEDRHLSLHNLLTQDTMKYPIEVDGRSDVFMLAESLVSVKKGNAQNKKENSID